MRSLTSSGRNRESPSEKKPEHDRTPSDHALAAGEPLAGPPPPSRRWPYYWLAALLLHILVIGALLLLLRREPAPMEAQSPPGVAVVFQNGGTPQPSQAPPAPYRGPSMPAQSAAAAAPPPPAAASAAPEVNLNLPSTPFAALPQPAPQPQPQPQPKAQAAPAREATRSSRTAPHYLAMNNMSFGNPEPPMPNAKSALNLSLPQSSAPPANTPEITIRGQVGPDWEAGFDKWVYAHLYYPDAAAEQGQQGTVTVNFTAHRDGSVTGLHEVASSGSPFLDQAWLGIFAQNQLPKFPPGGSDTLNITATVHYMITR